jgi:Xaa-Pro aminopeptidase
MQATLLLSHAAQMEVCGFGCDNAIVLQTPSEQYFITDGRYVIEAKETIKDRAQVIEGGRSLIKTTRLWLRRLGIQRLSYDPKEWKVEAFEQLKKGFEFVQFIPRPNLSQLNRQIKSDDDLKRLQKAVDSGAKAFDEFVEFVKTQGVGLSEKELHFEALRFFTCKGQRDVSFSPIVAINANAAKPHALPTDLVLKWGDTLLLDAGVIEDGFCSDRTRTFCVKPQMDASKSQKFDNALYQKVYDTVLRAQEAALNISGPGVRASEVDRAAREVIKEAGFGEYFVHSTGHGVGRDIHELPVISSSSSTLLEPGMVYTIEPGIYLPSEIGVRIEDMVVVESSGIRVL